MNQNRSLKRFFKDDFLAGLRAYPAWLALASRVLNSLTRRTKLGLLWQTLSIAFIIVCLGLVYSIIFSIPVETLLPHIAIGYVLWMFISGALNGAPLIFVTYGGYISQKGMPISTFVLSDVVYRLYILIIQSTVIVATLFFFRIYPDWTVFVILPAILIYTIAAFGLILTLGIIAVRYRDVAQLVNSSIFLLFLLTPILWKPEAIPNSQFIVNFNPIYHFIELIRAPLLEQRIPYEYFATSATASLFLLLVGFAIAARFRDRIVFWL